MTDQEERVGKARNRLMLETAFFASLLIRTPVKVTDRSDGGSPVETAATDFRSIYINPQFASQLSIGEIMWVMCHEVLHNICEHSIRRGHRAHQRWNIAGDHVINLALAEHIVAIRDCQIKEPKGRWYKDGKYTGWATEKVYEDLDDDAGGGGGSALDGDVLPMPGGNDAAATAEARADMQSRVAQASMQAQLQGQMTGQLKNLVDELLNAKVPWEEVLRDKLTRLARDEESWQRRNRRYSHVVLPALYSLKVGPIAVIGDSSGSIWSMPDELKRFAAEMQAIFDQLQPEKLIIVWADSEVAGVDEFEPGDTLRFDVKGGGGTDMRVPLKFVEKFEPEAVVMLTDGYTPWPDAEPEYPLVVVCTTDVNVPVGEVIRI